ncbi:hypothetical protein [Streptomyces sp. NBC_00582]|nr:hypothetical protein [Streptomyces sp. NBC_00582]WUB67438.1 hypothetical protein OG852_47130 [Streptomyces sp. NBC_00582]
MLSLAADAVSAVAPHSQGHRIALELLDSAVATGTRCGRWSSIC